MQQRQGQCLRDNGRKAPLQLLHGRAVRRAVGHKRRLRGVQRVVAQRLDARVGRAGLAVDHAQLLRHRLALRPHDPPQEA